MPDVAVPLDPTDTDTVVAEADAVAVEAVTVTDVADAPSPTLDGLTSRLSADAVSSSLIVPVPVSLAVTPDGASETDSPTVNVSSPSTTASSVVDTVNVFVSPFVPVNESADVFSS